MVSTCYNHKDRIIDAISWLYFMSSQSNGENKNAFLSNSINEVFNDAFHSPPASKILNMLLIECKKSNSSDRNVNFLYHFEKRLLHFPHEIPFTRIS